ncbi:hypothetical protein [Halanaerobium kushneri]|nr:hypothetical protein [Halanaerobium kushneri]
MLKRVIKFFNEVSTEGRRIENNLRQVKNQYDNQDTSTFMQY